MVIHYILEIVIIVYIFFLTILLIPKIQILIGGLVDKISPPHPPTDEVEDGKEDELQTILNEFNSRIERLKVELSVDENGLYNYYDDEGKEFTGTEIITESREMELDKV